MFARPRTNSGVTALRRTRLRLEALEDRWNPVSVVVTSTADDGAGSLRAAVATINTAGQAANTITFNLPANEDNSWDIQLQSELVVNANVTITGPTINDLPALTIHGNKPGFFSSGNRVFTVGEGRSLTLLKLELLDGAAPSSDPNGGLIKVLTAGELTIRDSRLWGGVASGDGGGIWAGLDGRVTVTNTEIRRNEAGGNGGGIAFSGERLWVYSTNTTSPIYAATILFNDAGGNGGGVWVNGTGNTQPNSPRVIFERVNVAGNEAGESGGGFYLNWTVTATGVPVALTDVFVGDNAALRNFAGGIFVNANTRLVGTTSLGSSVTRNTARQPEAGIYDGSKKLIKVGNINEEFNSQVIPENPDGPTDPFPPIATYIGPAAEALLVSATISADGAGATYFWNDGRLEISSTEEPRDTGSSAFAGNYTQTASATFAVDLADAGYDQFVVGGAPYQVTLDGALALYPTWSTPPEVGTKYTVIRNDTDQPTVGTFAGYPDGYEFWISGAKLRITYNRTDPGADPNDVILEVVTPPAVVTGRLFNDGWEYTNGTAGWDRDGLQTGSEAWYSGVVVELLNADGTVFATTQTDANGNYSFTVTTAGSFRVRFALPTSTNPMISYRFTAANQGSDAIDSDADALGETALFAVAPGGNYDFDAGVVQRINYFI